jgi:hypothetical protein
VHPPDGMIKTQKRSTTLEVKTSSFYWCQQSGDVSPTPSTWQAEGIFGLEWPDWAYYLFLVGGLHWLQVDGILLYVINHLLMSTIWDVIPYQHLSHDSWLLGFLTPHLVPINIYLCSLMIFVRILTTKVTESCSFKNWFMLGLTVRTTMLDQTSPSPLQMAY